MIPIQKYLLSSPKNISFSPKKAKRLTGGAISICGDEPAPTVALSSSPMCGVLALAGSCEVRGGALLGWRHLKARTWAPSFPFKNHPSRNVNSWEDSRSEVTRFLHENWDFVGNKNILKFYVCNNHAHHAYAHLAIPFSYPLSSLGNI